MHEEQEVQVHRQLREVLTKERVGTHQFTERNRLLEHGHCVVDAKRV